MTVKKILLLTGTILCINAHIFIYSTNIPLPFLQCIDWKNAQPCGSANIILNESGKKAYQFIGEKPFISYNPFTLWTTAELALQDKEKTIIFYLWSSDVQSIINECIKEGYDSHNNKVIEVQIDTLKQKLKSLYNQEHVIIYKSPEKKQPKKSGDRYAAYSP